MMKASPSLAGAPLVSDWLEFRADGTLLVRTGKVEIGQHIGAALARIVADELDLSPSDVTIAAPDTERAPNEGYTSGSNSVEHSGEALRFAAATARRELLSRAALRLEVDPAQLECSEAVCRHRLSNRALSFAELANDAPLNLAVDIHAPVKVPQELRAVGSETLEAPVRALVSGQPIFVHDLDWPDMLHARVVRPPHAHARLVAAPERMPTGWQDIVLVRDGSFLAVAGVDEYRVVKAAQHLASLARWDAQRHLSVGDIFSALRQNRSSSRAVLDGTPVAGQPPGHPPPPGGAAASLEARFERPYQMHASLGPSAAAALAEDGAITVWSATQGIFPSRGAIAQTLDLPEHAVRVIHVPGSGCYGHNGADDAALDAALVARALPGRHIALKWTREQEHMWEPYATCMGVDLRASLDAHGTIIDWCHDVYGDTHLGRPRPGPGRSAASRLLAARHLADPAPEFVAEPAMGRHTGNHRNADPIYTFERRSVRKHLVRDLPHRTSAMRTLGGFANVFAIESFMDELAQASGADALAFRLSHLEDRRARAVLETAATAIGWPGPDLTDGEGIGLAVAQYKNAQAYAAVGVILSVDDAAKVQLKCAVIVVDAGRVVDPAGLRAQMEGGFIQAASWALKEAVTWQAEGITSVDWETYPVIRFSDVPDIEVQLIDHPELPSLGAGEASSGPAGGAIANAIARATGVRPRRMPFTPDNLRAAALQQ